MKTNHHQSGFSVVEALLILIIVSILSFTGWFVYHSKQIADKTLNQTNNSTVAPSNETIVTQQSQTKYLVIKEWNVALPLGSNFIDATYSCLGQNCSVPNEFGISTISLAKLDPGCAANASGVGFLARQTILEHDVNFAKAKSDPDNSGADPAYANPIYSKRIGSYYYQSITSNQCSDTNVTANEKSASYIKAFENAFNGMKAI